MALHKTMNYKCNNRLTIIEISVIKYDWIEGGWSRVYFKGHAAALYLYSFRT